MLTPFTPLARSLSLDNFYRQVCAVAHLQTISSFNLLSDTSEGAAVAGDATFTRVSQEGENTTLSSCLESFSKTNQFKELGGVLQADQESPQQALQDSNSPKAGRFLERHLLRLSINMQEAVPLVLLPVEAVVVQASTQSHLTHIMTPLITTTTGSQGVQWVQ